MSHQFPVNRNREEVVVLGGGSEPNAYGTVVATNTCPCPMCKDKVQNPTPIICGHGGSMWLCQACADECLQTGEGRHASPAESQSLQARND